MSFSPGFGIARISCPTRASSCCISSFRLSTSIRSALTRASSNFLRTSPSVLIGSASFSLIAFGDGCCMGGEAVLLAIFKGPVFRGPCAWACSGDDPLSPANASGESLCTPRMPIRCTPLPGFESLKKLLLLAGLCDKRGPPTRRNRPAPSRSAPKFSLTPSAFACAGRSPYGERRESPGVPFNRGDEA